MKLEDLLDAGSRGNNKWFEGQLAPLFVPLREHVATFDGELIDLPVDGCLSCGSGEGDIIGHLAASEIVTYYRKENDPGDRPGRDETQDEAVRVVMNLVQQLNAIAAEISKARSPDRVYP